MSESDPHQVQGVAAEDGVETSETNGVETSDNGISKNRSAEDVKNEVSRSVSLAIIFSSHNPSIWLALNPELGTLCCCLVYQSLLHMQTEVQIHQCSFRINSILSQ